MVDNKSLSKNETKNSKQSVISTNPISENRNPLREESHIFLAIIPPVVALPLAKKMKFITKILQGIDPNFPRDLKRCGYIYTAEEYLGVGVISYAMLGAIFGFLVAFAALQKDNPLPKAILLGVLIFFIAVLLLSYLAIKSPISTLKRRSIDVEKTLIYALKDMVLTTKSGGNLYEGMVAVANTDYGELSREFDRVVRRVNVGYALPEAVDEMIERTESDYMKKTGWRIINTFKTGSDVEVAFNPIINELDTYQKNQIVNYAKELNLWSLVFMLFSVAIPTIGSTMLIVMSAFAQGGVTPVGFVVFGIMCVFFQMGIIMLVKSRRPNVQF